jgi:hypothetical protein
MHNTADTEVRRRRKTPKPHTHNVGTILRPQKTEVHLAFSERNQEAAVTHELQVRGNLNKKREMGG